MYTLENQAFEDVSPIRKAMFLCHICFLGGVFHFKVPTNPVNSRFFFALGDHRWVQSIALSLLPSKGGCSIDSIEQPPFEGNRRVSIKFNNCQLQASHLKSLDQLVIGKHLTVTTKSVPGTPKVGTQADSGSSSPWWLEEWVTFKCLSLQGGCSRRVQSYLKTLRFVFGHFEARVASALTFAAIGTSASSLSLEESNGSVVFGYKEQAQAAVASAGAWCDACEALALRLLPCVSVLTVQFWATGNFAASTSKNNHFS